MAKRCNHKLAIKELNASELIRKFEKEVIQDFLVRFSVQIITKMQHLSITPLGCPKQWPVNEKGERIPKYRPTHDCTFANESGSFLNIQIIDEELDSCIFEQCLRRLLHQLHQLRLENPNRKIYVVKHDLDAAYRRLHVHPDFAVRCTTIIKDVAYLLVQLPFGVSAGPSMYGLISKAIFDLVNDLLLRVQPKIIESIIGKLNHAAFLLPHARYFLNNLRKLHYNCEKYGSQHMNETTKEDMELWKAILTNATKNEISINLLTYTEWSEAIYTDACEHGIGGFNPVAGRAWRLQLPEWLIGYHINALKFLASFIGLWIEIINNEKKYARFLCMTDSSSALAWLHKSNFDPFTQKIQSQIARKLALTTMRVEVALYSQHVPGCQNIVTDSLSRDHHIETNKITFLLKQLYPSQAQENFHILQELPKEIAFWLELL